MHTTGLGAPFDAILDAVARTSPKGLTLGDLDRTGSLGGWTLDGNVDDGHGAARLYVVVAPASVGGMIARPCSDYEFRGGGPCSTHTLADGTTVTVQGPAGTDGYRIEHVVVVHPDGSAVLVEADNASIPPTPQVLTSADKKTYRMPITRDEPIYTTAQLTTLALAVDAAVLG